jgi:hypothetical protein
MGHAVLIGEMKNTCTVLQLGSIKGTGNLRENTRHRSSILKYNLRKETLHDFGANWIQSAQDMVKWYPLLTY